MFAENWISLIGNIYIGVVIVVLVLALWLPKKAWAKGVAAASVLGLAFGVPYLISRPTAAQVKTESEFAARAAKAKSRFEQLCKEKAELTIHRKVTGVKGIRLMNVVKGKDVPRSYWERDWRDAGMAGEFSDDSFIKSFLVAGILDQDGVFGGGYSFGVVGDVSAYEYVDVRQEDGRYRRYRLGLNDREVSYDEKLLSEGDPGLARYAIDFNNELNMEDRMYWIAGTEVTVRDTSDGSVLGVMRKYSRDPGLGNSRNRMPWLEAVSHSCPDLRTGFVHGEVRFFVSKVVEENRGGK